MIFALPFIIVPLIFFAYHSHGKNTTTAIKVLVSVVTSTLVFVAFNVARQASMLDYEMWSGKVTAKTKGTQSCCHCRDVCNHRDKNGRCTSSTTKCDHFHDYWWGLNFSTGDSFRLEECSGWDDPPPSWKSAYVGEPAVLPHAFSNPFLASDESLFIHGSDHQGKAPPYPQMQGTYKADRVISMIPGLDERPWRKALDEMMVNLGPAKHVNIILVLTTDPNMPALIERDWRYGKMNDAIFIVGISGDVAEWVDVVTPPTGNTTLVESARLEIPGTKIDPASLLPKIEEVVRRDWAWHSLEKFAYLAMSARPTWMGWLGVLLTAAFCTFVGAVVIDSNNKKMSRRMW